MTSKSRRLKVSLNSPTSEEGDRDARFCRRKQGYPGYQYDDHRLIILSERPAVSEVNREPELSKQFGM
jgi:hypothetical protein